MGRKIRLFHFITKFLFLLSIVIPWGFVEAQDYCDIAVFQKLNRGDNNFVEHVYKGLKKLYPDLIMVPEVENLRNLRKTLRDYGIQNIQDLQNNIEYAFNNNNCACINDLYIVGHGNEGIISVGTPARAKKRNIDEYINGNEAEWSGPLQQIRNRFCAYPSVYFIGCNVGSCNKGRDKLFKLAQTLNATVSAPVDKVGKISDYIDHGRWQYATPTNKPDHMAANRNQRARRRPIIIAGTGVGPGFDCPCNGSIYTGIQECTNSCSVTLGCFTGICDLTYTSSNRWNKYDGNPVMIAGTSVSSSAIESTEISGWDELGFSQTTLIKNGPTNKMWNMGSDPSEISRIGYAGMNVSGATMRSGSIGTTAIPGWEDGGVSQPSVIKDSSLYKMWYMGSDESNAYWRIGYATSTDGVNWTKYSGNPVLEEGPPGSWDSGSVYNPSVIKDGNTYKMWYHGYSDMSRIGYATSTDGINWTKYSQPILDLGPTGAWDYHGVGEPTVIKDGNLYKMWYAGYDGWWWRIGYATSTDGINWTKHPNNPVLSEGAQGSWEEGHIGGPSVIKDGSTYHMLYGSQDSSDIARIGYATSKDGIYWTKSPDNPFLGEGLGDWDDTGVYHPTLFKDLNENIFKVFYRGYGTSDNGIGFATATSILFFGDVSFNDWAEKYINAIFIAGITVGCGDDNYCPEANVTREQMAAFIVRAVEGEPATNYCDTGTPFPDVIPDMWSCKYIKRLKELGITTGYSDGTYGPYDVVSREQMAAFIVRAIEGEPSANYCDTGTLFPDVIPSMWSCKYIKRLKELGITTGYSDGTYGPYDIVTRAQMAAFLARAFLDIQ